MAYVVIEDFRAGLDRRKLPAASPQGSLQVLKNAHISRGGEIEKRMAFQSVYNLPAGKTFGFAGANGILYTFGSQAAVTMPAGVTYQRLQSPDGAAMKAIICVEFFDGKPFVIAEFTNNKRHCFYNGALVTAFNSGSGAVNVQGARPAWLLTHRDKIYECHSSILAFCAIDEPTIWWEQPDPETGVVTHPGFGYKNMSNQSAGSENLTALGRYQNLMAVFARRSIQIWYLDPDPLENVQKQVLENIGTYAPKSVVPFGDVDVFFLSDSGVRSLRARDSSNQSGVADVGTAIDEYLLDYLSTLTAAQKAAAVGCLEPLTGRYLLAVGNRCFVFSFFPASKTSAWSTYEFDNVEIKDFVTMDGRVYARSGDTIYLLGGQDGKTYNSVPVEVEIPYIDGRQIATFKSFKGIDLICEGEWRVFANTDPDQPEEWSELGVVNGTTLTQLSLGMVGYSPLIKLKLVNEAPGPARLSKIVVHYVPAESN